MRLVGRRQWGGAHSEQLLHAITQIQTTLVCANFRNGDGRYIEERFNIFSKTQIEGRTLHHSEFASSENVKALLHVTSIAVPEKFAQTSVRAGFV